MQVRRETPRDEAMSDAVARVDLDSRAHGDDGPDGRGHSQGAGRQDDVGAARSCSPGPAVVASIAYMDPGNFATNIQAGAKYGYALLWVVLTASVAAMLFQSLSAKLGIVTGRNLAELCREHFPKPVVWALMDRQRDRGDGDRPRRIPRRRDWSFAPAAYPAPRRHGRHGRPHLRHPDVRRPRVSPDRTHHRRARRRDRPLLSRRDGHRPGRLGRGGAGQRGSTIAGRRRGDARGRHRRRDDHAARDLPAFRAHPEPGAGAQRPRAAAPGAVLEHRGPRRPRDRRPRQYGDGHHGRERVPRRPQRRRRDRDRL